MFLSYHKEPYQMEKMLLSQLGNNGSNDYHDGILNHFKVSHGNMFYTPNIFELTGYTPENPDINLQLIDLCEYHQTTWLKHFGTSQEDE